MLLVYADINIIMKLCRSFLNSICFNFSIGLKLAYFSKLYWCARNIKNSQEAKKSQKYFILKQ